MEPRSPFEIVAAALNCPASTLSVDSGLGRHPNWDSLGHVAIMVALEEQYGVVVTDEAIRRFEQMGEIIAFFDERTDRSGGGFDTRWETKIYGEGRMLNRYPSEVIVSFVLSTFPPGRRKGQRVLDLGCGAGNNVSFLAREGFDVVGIDGSRTAVEFARQRLAAENLSAQLIVGDFRRLDFEANSFDCIIDRGALTHNRRAAIEQCLDEVRRVLKPGGLFFSQMFSSSMADREFGQPLGDGSYDSFTAGYFSDIGLTFFANREEIAELYSKRFEEREIHHWIIEDGAGRIESALWNNVWCRR